MSAPVPPFENESLRTFKVTKKKGNKLSQTQSPNPPHRIWTTDEDIALTLAYLYISVDSIVGKDQTSERMWSHILVVWMENMGTYVETYKANDLSCHCDLIQDDVTKFHATYESLERAPKSGNAILDM
ncbi:hypothetical protein MKX03_033904, partial [Papaver bracteatum]